jgi:hypothetical protein
MTSIAPSTQIVRFDPTSQTFQSWAIPGGGEIVRNMAVTGDGNVALAIVWSTKRASSKSNRRRGLGLCVAT